MLNVDGQQIDLVESGQGPALLFVPGSYSTPAAWRQVQRLISPGWRVVTTSLCGYGATADTRTGDNFGIQHEVRVLQAVARHVGEPVHLIGHSFGATVALAAAVAGAVDVASLSLFEANPMAIIRDRGEGALYRGALRMSKDFDAAVTAGEYDAAGRIIDFWGGPGVFAAMPDVVKAYCREKVGVNVLDWRCDFDFAVTEADCARLDLPVLLVRGGNAVPAMVEITDALRGSLPQVRHATVEGAGHFLINSHAAQCAQLLSAFLARVAGDRA